jgi:hypothetical protein
MNYNPNDVDAEARAAAVRLAAAKNQTTGRKEMKASRERLLQYMVDNEKSELTVDGVCFTVIDKPQPIKPAALFAETLKRHFRFKDSQIDELHDRVEEVKEVLCERRPTLSIKTKSKKKANGKGAAKDKSDKDEYSVPMEVTDDQSKFVQSLLPMTAFAHR